MTASCCSTEAPDGVHGVEVMQVEPLVTERPPKSLDHRVRVNDIDSSKDALQDAGVEERVLASAIDHDFDGFDRRVESVESGFENLDGIQAIAFVCDNPGEDSATEIVDGGMHVGPRAVEVGSLRSSG